MEVDITSVLHYWVDDFEGDAKGAAVEELEAHVLRGSRGSRGARKEARRVRGTHAVRGSLEIEQAVTLAAHKVLRGWERRRARVRTHSQRQKQRVGAPVKNHHRLLRGAQLEVLEQMTDRVCLQIRKTQKSDW